MDINQMIIEENEVNVLSKYKEEFNAVKNPIFNYFKI